jgi:hypothetical protein
MEEGILMRGGVIDLRTGFEEGVEMTAVGCLFSASVDQSVSAYYVPHLTFINGYYKRK